MPHFKDTAAALTLGLILAAVAPTATAAGQPTMVLSNDEHKITRLTIGDTLRVHLDGAAPHTTYQARLLDEAQGVVASAELLTNGQGDVSGQLLWLRSGVVGCDPLSFPNPLQYRFSRFGHAEQVLAGRTFRVALVDPVSAVELASVNLPLVVDSGMTRFALGEGSGCPRWQMYEHQDVYLTTHRLAPEVKEIRIFLVAHPEKWVVGSPLVDLRPDLPKGQVIKLTGSPNDLPALVWPDLDTIGEVAWVIRTSNDGPTDDSPDLDLTDHTSGRDPLASGAAEDEPTDCPSCWD